MSSILLRLHAPHRAAAALALAGLLLGTALIPGSSFAQDVDPADVGAGPAVDDAIPAAPPPPPLGATPETPAFSPADEQEQAGPRPLLPGDPPVEADPPVESDQMPPAEPEVAEPEGPRPETAPAGASEPRSVALPDSPNDGENVPLPPRRPAPPPDFAAVPATTGPTSAPNGEGDRFTDDGSQRFARDLDQPRSGFRRVEGDMLWERAPIPPTIKTACTTRVARLGSSLAASLKDQGLWPANEKLTLSVDCDDGEERPIGTFLCEAQDFAPVLDLSCRLERPAR